MHKYSKGMTLVEVMVVMVIIAVLMSVAVPSYRQFTIRANRADAHSSLMQLAANQERFYLQNNTYANNAQMTLEPPNGLGVATKTNNEHYTVAITAADATAFSAVATAAGGQAKDTDCDVIAINERGVRYGGPGPAFSGNNDPDCW